MSSSETYLFMSNPQPVTTFDGRPKYREPEEVQDDIAATSNVMWDPRVVRGKTSGKPIQMMTSRFQFAPEPYQKSSSMLRKENRERKERLVRRGVIRPSFPSVNQIHAAIAVPKTRVEVPLHLYLQEQEEKIQMHELSSQTDPFVQEEADLAAPVYIPRKTGTDIGTQVDPELVFQYDEDVKPILQTVISKTLEQSMIEVLQEEEMEFMRKRMVSMMAKRKREKQKCKEQEETERALRKAMELKIKAARERYLREKDVQKKTASRIVSKRFLSHLQNDVMARLTRQHYFFEPLDDQVNNFMPWLYDKLYVKLGKETKAVSLVEEMVMTGVHTISQRREKVLAERVKKQDEKKRMLERRERNKQLRAKRKMKVEMYIHCDEMGEEGPVGPLRLTGQNTVADVEQLVMEWLNDKMETPPERKYVKFLWSGKELTDNKIILYELGLDKLSEMRLYIEPPPPAPAEEDGSSATADDTTSASVDDR